MSTQPKHSPLSSSMVQKIALWRLHLLYEHAHLMCSNFPIADCLVRISVYLTFCCVLVFYDFTTNDHKLSSSIHLLAQFWWLSWASAWDHSRWERSSQTLTWSTWARTEPSSLWSWDSRSSSLARCGPGAALRSRRPPAFKRPPHSSAINGATKPARASTPSFSSATNQRKLPAFMDLREVWCAWWCKQSHSWRWGLYLIPVTGLEIRRHGLFGGGQL